MSQRRDRVAQVGCANPDEARAIKHLELSIDFGTSSCKVSYRLHFDDKTYDRSKPVRIRGESAEIPSCFAYYNGNFFYGHDLKRRLREPQGSTDHVPCSTVVECSKLLYYGEGTETGAIAQRAKDVLGNRTPDEATRDYLKHLLEDLRAYLQGQKAGKVGANTLNSAPIKARLSVPQIWSLTARRRMAKAAHEAGIETVVLASEPQCVLARWLDQEKEEGLESDLQDGDYILVADLGCGTADFVLYRVKGDLTVSTRLETDEMSSGALCGSIRVNQEIFEKVQPAPDKWQDECARMGMTQAELSWHLLQSIETAKVNRDRPAFAHIVVNHPDTGAEYRRRITRQDLEDAQQPSINQIMRNMDKMIKKAGNKLKLILAAGGFRKSECVMGKINAKYNIAKHPVISCSDRSGPEETMVSEGGLSARYSMVAEQSLPTLCGYAYLRDEEVDKTLHPDCYYGGIGGRQIGMRISKKSKKSAYDGKTDITIDRMKVVLPKGSRVGKKRVVEDHRAAYYCRVKDGIVSWNIRFVFFTGEYKNHDSALQDDHDCGKEDNPLRHDVHDWAIIKGEISERKLISRGFKALTDQDGLPYYTFDAYVVLTYNGEDNITVSWDVVTEPKDKSKDLEVKGKEEVWSARASEFTREHEGDLMETRD